MSRILAGVLVFGLVAIAGAEDQQKDFSGHWKMDTTRSESAHQSVPIGQITLTITQTATELNIETTTTDGQNPGSSVETLTYKLDGSETTIGRSGVPVSTRARWDGPKLVTETVRQINSVPVVMQNILTLGPDKKELTVDRTLMVQHGYQSRSGNNTGTGKDIFVRTKGSGRK